MFSSTNCRGEFVLWNKSEAACMSEKHHSAWPSVEDSLKSAALLPQQRGEMITCALHEVLSHVPAVATALIWPGKEKKGPWKVYYAGMRQDATRPWLMARLEPSLDVTCAVVQHDLNSSFPDMPQPLMLRLQASSVPAGGLWIIWPAQPSALYLPHASDECLERVRRTLEALLEVEGTEEQFF